MFEEVADPEEAKKLLSEVDKLDEPADRASVLDMVIKTARFFPTNVYSAPKNCFYMFIFLHSSTASPLVTTLFRSTLPSAAISLNGKLF